MGYEDVFEAVRRERGLSREEFDRRVEELRRRLRYRISERGAAMLVAESLGIDISRLLRPPIVGRVLDVGRVQRGRTRYRLFTLVNGEGRFRCVAFGEEHIRALEGLEDRAVELVGYVPVDLEWGRLIRVTEHSKINLVSEDALPPVYELGPARASSIGELKGRGGTWIVDAIVIDEVAQEMPRCPICGGAVELTEEGVWHCPVDGPVGPDIVKTYRYYLADSTGVYEAAFYGEPPRPTLKHHEITIKARFRGEELYIYRIYRAERAL